MYVIVTCPLFLKMHEIYESRNKKMKHECDNFPPQMLHVSKNLTSRINDEP